MRPHAFLLLSLFMAPAAAQEEVAEAADPYIHRQTGMAFPAVVGPFVRRHVTLYSRDGADTGVGYDLNRDGAKIGYVSVFVYPAPAGAAKLQRAQRKYQCRTLFDAITQNVLAQAPGGHVVGRGSVPAPTSGGDDGFSARFAGASMEFAGKQQPIEDDASLYCPQGTDWLIAYRVTWLAGATISEDAAVLLKAIRWPAMLTH